MTGATAHKGRGRSLDSFCFLEAIYSSQATSQYRTSTHYPSPDSVFRRANNRIRSVGCRRTLRGDRKTLLQCLVSIQGIASGSRLDTFLQTEGNVISWLLGYALGVCSFYLISSLRSTAILRLLLDFPLAIWRMLLFAFLSIPATLGIVCFVYGFEI